MPAPLLPRQPREDLSFLDFLRFMGGHCANSTWETAMDFEPQSLWGFRSSLQDAVNFSVVAIVA
jgi:hypothetical protein